MCFLICSMITSDLRLVSSHKRWVYRVKFNPRSTLSEEMLRVVMHTTDAGAAAIEIANAAAIVIACGNWK